MRRVLILLMLLLIVASCARKFVYRNKGIHYVDKPVRELEAIGRFKPHAPEQSQAAVFITGTPARSENIIHYPVVTNYLREGIRYSDTVVYAYDIETESIRDSLVLADESQSSSFKHLIVADSIMVIGVRDSILSIVKADKDLQMSGMHSMGIRTNLVIYAAMFRGKLRLVMVDANNNLLLHEIDPLTMQPHRNRLLAKNYFKSYQDGAYLWLFSETEKDITFIKLNMMELDPEPKFNRFDYAILDAYGMQTYRAVAAGNTIYIGHTVKGDKETINYRLVSFDFDSGQKQSRDLSGYVSFDVLSRGDRTYIFRTDQQKNRNVLRVSELGTDMHESAPLIRFFLTDLHSVHRLLDLGNDHVLLMGSYLEKSSGKDRKSDGRTTGESANFKPFVALYELE